MKTLTNRLFLNVKIVLFMISPILILLSANKQANAVDTSCVNTCNKEYGTEISHKSEVDEMTVEDCIKRRCSDYSSADGRDKQSDSSDKVLSESTLGSKDATTSIPDRKYKLTSSRYLDAAIVGLIIGLGASFRGCLSSIFVIAFNIVVLLAIFSFFSSSERQDLWSYLVVIVISAMAYGILRTLRGIPLEEDI